MSLPPKMSGAHGDESDQQQQQQQQQHQGPLSSHPPQGTTPGLDSHIPAYDPAHPNSARPVRADSTDIYDADDMKRPTGPTVAGAAAETTAAGSKPGGTRGHSSFGVWANKLSALGTKAAAPINAMAQKVGAEGFLPSTMDKECEKAGRILRAFCKEGVYTDHVAESSTRPPSSGKSGAGNHAPSATNPDGGSTAGKAVSKNRTIVKIPSRVIQRAVGLAIFTTARLAYGVSGATGSGILIARMPDGRWSPPSGIQVHTVGAGFVMGVDIYDCVVVINTQEALAAFTRTRMSLGSDIAVAAGPWGAGGAVDFGLPESKGKGRGRDSASPQPPAAGAGAPPPGAAAPVGGYEQPPQLQQQQEDGGRRKSTDFRPVFSYVKSRGLFAGLQVDGTIVTERKDANVAFYGVPGISVTQILKGDVPLTSPAGNWERHARALVAVICGAEGYQAVGADQNPSLDPPVQLTSQAPNQGAPTSAGFTVSPAAAFKASEAGADAFYYPPPPPGPPPAAATGAPQAMTKAQEAAAESAGAYSQGDAGTAAPPPRYSVIVDRPGEGAVHQQADGPEPPPPFVDDGVSRPGVGDSKTGQH